MSSLRARHWLAAGVALSVLFGLGLVAFAGDGTGNPSDEGIVITPARDTPPPSPAAPAPAPAATPTPDPEPARPELRDDHVQAVVTAHELATDAGLEMLARGGTAADAAVAIAAALSVVEPWFSSALGGGTWALYYDAASDAVTSLDGVGPTGSNASRADYAGRAGTPGMHQSNVPGAWDGWMLWMDRYGRLDLHDVLEPAIRIAREGYPVSPEMVEWLGRGNVGGRPSTAAIYAPNGRLLRQGETVHQHGMARTFEALADEYRSHLPEGRGRAIQAARDYYYRGPIAEAIVDFSDRFGGYLTLPDFHGFEAQIVEPISIRYNEDITVYQSPPNSQGITMLIALNILKGLNLGSLDPNGVDTWHLQIEAIKLAFSDRYHHVGDPDRVDVPVLALLSEEHAERQRARIDINRPMVWPVADGLRPPAAASGDTTTFQVVDRHGNAASVTTSLGAQFFVVGETGIHINNRMRFLSIEPGNVNEVTPGFKVRHTSNPYMAFRNGRPYILGGNTGADIQVQGQVQQFVNVVEFGMGAQEAVSRPRFISYAFPATNQPWGIPNILRIEHGAPGGVLAALRARGHAADEWFGSVGNAGLLVLSEDGTHADIGVERRLSTASGAVLEPEP